VLDYFTLRHLRDHLDPGAPRHLHDALEAEIANHTVLVFEDLGPDPHSIKRRRFRVGVRGDLRTFTPKAGGAHALYRVVHGEALTAGACGYPTTDALWAAVRRARDEFVLRCPALAVLSPCIVWRGNAVRFEQPPWEIEIYKHFTDTKAAEWVRR
jgi:hypothetical protein